MVLDYSVLLSGFALGLFIGVVSDLINKITLAFARWEARKFVNEVLNVVKPENLNYPE